MAPGHSKFIRFACCGEVWKNTSIDNAASQEGVKSRLDDNFILARIYKLFSSSRCTTIKDGIDVQGPTHFNTTVRNITVRNIFLLWHGKTSIDFSFYYILNLSNILHLYAQDCLKSVARLQIRFAILATIHKWMHIPDEIYCSLHCLQGTGSYLRNTIDVMYQLWKIRLIYKDTG